MEFIAPITLNQTDLDYYLSLHKIWIATNGADGRQLVLDNADLSGLNLQGTLENSKFLNCIMKFCKFENINASSAIFLNCNFSESILNNFRTNAKAKLTNCNFNKIKVTNSHFIETDILITDALGVQFFSTTFENSNFDSEELNGDFQHLSFTYRSRLSAKILAGQFQNIIFDNSFLHVTTLACSLKNFRAKSNSSFTANIFKDRALENCFFENSSIDLNAAENIDFRSVVFSNLTYLSGGFKGCNFEGMQMSSTTGGTIFQKCTFRNCQMKNMDMTNSSVSGGLSFLRTSISGSNFSNMQIKDFFVIDQCEAINLKAKYISGNDQANFSRSDFTGSDFFDADFVNGYFGGSILAKCNFTKADLRKSALGSVVNHDDIILSEANLTGAVYFNARQCKIGSIGTCIQ